MFDPIFPGCEENKHAGEDAAEAAENERAREVAPDLLEACREALEGCSLGPPEAALAHVKAILRYAVNLAERGRCPLCGLVRDTEHNLCANCRMEEL